MVNKEDFHYTLNPGVNRKYTVGVIYYKQHPIHVFVRLANGIRYKENIGYCDDNLYAQLLISMIAYGQIKSAQHNLLPYLLMEKQKTQKPKRKIKEKERG